MAFMTINTLSAFVAIVAHHRRIDFVTHWKVSLYKRRAMELTAAAEGWLASALALRIPSTSLTVVPDEA